MLVEHGFEHCSRKQGWYGVADLLLLKANGALELVGVGKGLDAGSFAHRQPPILLGVDEHVLSEVPNYFSRTIPSKSVINPRVAQ